MRATRAQLLMSQVCCACELHEDVHAHSWLLMLVPRTP